MTFLPNELSTYVHFSVYLSTSLSIISISGLKSLGKAAYVITLSPYVVLTILLAYSAGREVNQKIDVVWCIGVP